MVRFKNRYLIVEFLQPSTSTAQVDITPQSIEFPENDEDEDVDPEDEDEINELPRIPIIPFLLPPIPDLKYLKDGEEGGKGIYKSVRGMVQDVFGDEGWGRISSSFRVIHHSPLTSMTLIRIARPHIRTVHAAITLISSVDGKAVLPRVVGVSGTVKKAQGRIMVYHRAAVAQMLARFDDGLDMTTTRAKGELDKRAETERSILRSLED